MLHLTLSTGNVHKRLNAKVNDTKYMIGNFAELDESKIRLRQTLSIY